jgi:hypothetical protein
MGFPRLLLFLEVAGDPDDVLVGAGVALLRDLPPDPGGVGAALFPPWQDIVFVGRDGANFLREVAPNGRGLEGQVFLHSVAVYSELSGHLGVLGAFLRKGVNELDKVLRLLPRTILWSLAVQAEILTGIPCQGRSASVLVYREWTLVAPFPHTGQRATQDEVLATRVVMAFSVARTPVRFSDLGAGSTVRESGMSSLDHLPDLLGCQLAAPFHRKLGRTTELG